MSHFKSIIAAYLVYPGCEMTGAGCFMLRNTRERDNTIQLRLLLADCWLICDLVFKIGYEASRSEPGLLQPFRASSFQDMSCRGVKPGSAEYVPISSPIRLRDGSVHEKTQMTA